MPSTGGGALSLELGNVPGVVLSCSLWRDLAKHRESTPAKSARRSPSDAFVDLKKPLETGKYPLFR